MFGLETCFILAIEYLLNGHSKYCKIVALKVIKIINVTVKEDG